jgi:hypothetical protein
MLLEINTPRGSIAVGWTEQGAATGKVRETC